VQVYPSIRAAARSAGVWPSQMQWWIKRAQVQEGCVWRFSEDGARCGKEEVGWGREEGVEGMEEGEGAEEEEEKDTECSVCARVDAGDLMLLCDACDRGWHLFCLAPPLSEIPQGTWKCPMCLQVEAHDIEEVARNGGGVNEGSAEWVCVKCTLRNAVAAPRCDACGAAAPPEMMRDVSSEGGCKTLEAKSHHSVATLDMAAKKQDGCSSWATKRDRTTIRASGSSVTMSTKADTAAGERPKTGSSARARKRDGLEVGKRVKVEAKYKPGTFYPGTVTRVTKVLAGTADNQRVRVKFDEGTLGSVEVESKDVRVCEDFEWCLQLALPPVAEGQRVEARYLHGKGGLDWFPGVVTKQRADGFYAIKYHDGDFEAKVRRENMRTLDDVKLAHAAAVEQAEGLEEHLAQKTLSQVGELTPLNSQKEEAPTKGNKTGSASPRTGEEEEEEKEKKKEKEDAHTEFEAQEADVSLTYVRALEEAPAAKRPRHSGGCRGGKKVLLIHSDSHQVKFVFSSGVEAAGTMGTKQACISRFCLANSARLDPKKGVFTWNGQRYYICYEQDRPQVGGTAGADTRADTIEYGAPPPFSSSLSRTEGKKEVGGMHPVAQEVEREGIQERTSMIEASPSRLSESLRCALGEADARRVGGVEGADGDGLRMVDVMLKLCLQHLGVVAARDHDHVSVSGRGGGGGPAARGSGAWASEDATAQETLQTKLDAVEARAELLRSHLTETTSDLHHQEDACCTTNAQVESLRKIGTNSQLLVSERDDLHEQLAAVEAALGEEHPTIEEGRECVVCWMRTSEVALMPCGHVCLCQNCPTLSSCPMCRAEVEGSLRVYLA